MFDHTAYSPPLTSRTCPYIMRAPVRYTVPLLASKFKIRQQRVMAILALKGMEHGEIPIHPGKRKPKTASSAAPPATQAETNPSDSSTAQASAPETEEQLDVRGQAVKAAMDEAATEIPRYLDNIAKKSESWQLQSTVGTPEQQETDSNILTAWIKSMVNDPFWVRPGKDEEEEEDPVPDTAELEGIQDDETMSKADEEVEQQYLQDYYQHEQQSRTSAGAPQEADTPQDEGYERYLLSDPAYLHHIMEHDVWDCHEAQGTGESHVKFIPKYPKFEVCLASLPANFTLLASRQPPQVCRQCVLSVYLQFGVLFPFALPGCSMFCGLDHLRWSVTI